MGHQFFIKVHEDMPDHPKIEPLSDKAFRLLVETWCWCKRLTNDGRMTPATWARRGTPRTRAELEKAGLVDVLGNTVVVHDYLVWQSSLESIEAKLAAKKAGGVEGNHRRWHVARGVVDPKCPLCLDPTTASVDRSDTDSQEGSDIQSVRESPEAEAEAEAEAEGNGHPPRPRPAPDAHGTRPPDRCPQHRHVDRPPPCGACADARRAAKAWDDQAPQRAATVRDAIRACSWCDSDGWRWIDPRRRYQGPQTGPTARCDHTAPIGAST